MRKTTIWVPTMSDKTRAVQSQKLSDNRAFVPFTSFILLSVVNTGENGTRLGGGGRLVDLQLSKKMVRGWKFWI